MLVDKAVDKVMQHQFILNRWIEVNVLLVDERKSLNVCTFQVPSDRPQSL